VVARVGGTPIARSVLEGQMAILADLKPASEDVVPVPPSFTGCIGYLDSSAKTAGAARPSAAAARARCRELYGSLVSRALQNLISGLWVRGWARELGVHVSIEELRDGLERGLARRYRTEAALHRFMSETGETIPDMLFSLQERLLDQGIWNKLNAEIGPVTNAKLVKYYAENRGQYHIGEQRDLEMVLTKKGAAAAARLKRELERGVSYAAIAERLLPEQLPFMHHGVVDGLEPQALGETSLDHAVFSARPGVVVGPLRLDVGPHFNGRSEQVIRAIDGYYLFTVTKVAPAHELSLAEVKPKLAPILPKLLEKRATAALVARLRPKWRALTNCAAGFVVLKCRQFKPAPGEPVEDPYTLD
jgi:hypothetical protein